jgi:hypothetical protein
MQLINWINYFFISLVNFIDEIITGAANEIRTGKF